MTNQRANLTIRSGDDLPGDDDESITFADILDMAEDSGGVDPTALAIMRRAIARGIPPTVIANDDGSWTLAWNDADLVVACR